MTEDPKDKNSDNGDIERYFKEKFEEQTNKSNDGSIDNFKVSKRKERDHLLQKMLEQSYESREVSYERKSRRKRIDDSLMMMDDYDSHLLRWNLQKCKKSQHRRIRKGGTDRNYSLSEFNPLNLRSDNPMRFSEGVGGVSHYFQKYLSNKDVCQSLWCPNCRKIVSKIYEDKIRSHLSIRLHPKDKPYENSDLHHLSGVVGVCVVNYDEVEKLIKKDNVIWKRVRRNVQKLHPKFSPFIESVYELELVNWIHLNTSSQSDFKKSQMRELIRHFKPQNNLMVFVHFHSITNLTKDQIDEVFKDYYFIDGKPLIKTNKKNGLYVQSFRSTQSLDLNIEKLCSYPFKDPIRYKHSFKGSDYQNGEYFEDEELSSLMKLYQRFQKRNWRGLFRSVNHPLSKELLYWKRLFPSDHPMWKDFQSDPFENIRGISPTYVVNRDGDVFTEGWNPNNFFGKSGLLINTIQRDRKVVGREYFQHPEFWWLTIYKNKYDFGEDKEVEKRISLEDFYYSKRFIKLKKDQYLSWSDGMFGRRYYRFIKDLNFSEVKDRTTYEWVEKTNPFHLKRLKFERGLEYNKNILINRLNTILNLDLSEQINYCTVLVKKKILTKKEYTKLKTDNSNENSKDELRRLLTLHIVEEIEKLEGRHNLEKFMK